MRKISCSIALLIFSATFASAEMTLAFKWGNIPSCTSGNPNRVANPEFSLKGVPDGTTKIVFKLTDLNVPGYNHGGGSLKVSGSGKIPSGAFKYKSPCPPNAVHTYEWSPTAKGGSKLWRRLRHAVNTPSKALSVASSHAKFQLEFGYTRNAKNRANCAAFRT